MLTGVDKFMKEREVLKYLKKIFTTEQNMPFDGVAKKGGNAHAFIDFVTQEQKDRFVELFSNSSDN